MLEREDGPMPISKKEIQAMRENSARKYAEQCAREKNALERYETERTEKVSKMMSTNELNKAVVKAASDGVSVKAIAEKHGLTEERVKRIIAKGVGAAGVVDAADLNADERAKLTAQAEADAGIMSEPAKKPEQAEEHGDVNIGDIYDIARNLMGAMRLANVPADVDVNITLKDNLCQLNISSEDAELATTMKWR